MIRPLYFFFRILGRRGTVQAFILSFAKMVISLLQFMPMIIILPMIRIVVMPNASKGLGRAGQILPENIKVVLENFVQNTPYQDMIIILIIAATIAQVLQGIITVIINQVMEVFLSKKQTALARSLFRSFLTYDYGRFKGDRPLQLITNGCVALTTVSKSLALLISSGFTIILATALLIYFFPLASLFGMGSFLTLTVISRFILAPYLKHLKVSGERAYQKAARSLEDRFDALKELKILGREKHLSEQFLEKTKKDAERSRALEIAKNTLQTILSSLHYLSLLVGFFAAVWFDYTPERTSAFLFVYILVMMRVVASVDILFGEYTAIKLQELNLEESYILMRELIGINLTQDDTTIPFEKEIKLENITFGYRDTGGSKPSKNAVGNISITIRKGEVVALVGKNGCGKTTLVDLLSAYHIPDKGKLLVDGAEITFHNAKSWQKNIGYVVQKPHIIDDSILENIIIGVDAERVDMERLAHITRITNLDEVTENLPDGIHSEVGSKGSKLSGGQAQRISIARALYRDSQVLFLDEATKSIDAASEKDILRGIAEHWKEKSIVMITHRVETLRQADKIYVMEQGKIVDQGTFEELSDTSELFRKLLGKEEIDQPEEIPAHQSTG